jgi:hypothetical protein
MPSPESATSIRSSSCALRVERLSDPPEGMAEMAFFMRLRIACFMNLLSMGTSGTPSSRSRMTDILASSSS